MIRCLSATAPELKAVEDESNFAHKIERKRELLQEEHQFNRLQMDHLYRHFKELKARSEVYERRRKRIQARIDEMTAECKALEEQLQGV